MRSITGNPVVGDDFHGRESELRSLSQRVRDGNHILLSGQRLVGKTSIARELGRRLGNEGWISVYANVERARSPEDVIAELACGMHSARPVPSRIFDKLHRLLRRDAAELDAETFRAKLRAELASKDWRDVGYDLLLSCSTHDQPVLLAIDELPVFLARLSLECEGERQVEMFLSWMRHALQTIRPNCPVAFLTGSIGFLPLASKLGIGSRINHLAPFHLEPWDRDTSIQCFQRLSKECGLAAEDDVAGAVYDALGIGLPHFVQRMFSNLRDPVICRSGAPATSSDVANAYGFGLLGSLGVSDLLRYESRLHEAFDNVSFSIAMELLAEAATKGVFSYDACRILECRHVGRIADMSQRIEHALNVLEHDGWLKRHPDGYEFGFKLLRDYITARFKGVHRPLVQCA